MRDHIQNTCTAILITAALVAAMVLAEKLAPTHLVQAAPASTEFAGVGQ